MLASAMVCESKGRQRVGTQEGAHETAAGMQNSLWTPGSPPDTLAMGKNHQSHIAEQ